MKKRKFKTHYNYSGSISEIKKDKDGNFVNLSADPACGSSVVRQGQVLSNKELIKRSLAGSIVDNIIKGHYYGNDHSSVDYESLNEKELTERLELVELESVRVRETSSKIKKHLERKKEEDGNKLVNEKSKSLDGLEEQTTAE